MGEIRTEVDADVRATALYALGRFQSLTPVGNPSTWKNPNSAPKGYVGGSLKKDFSLDKTKDGYFVGTPLPYAPSIWEDGHSKRLAEGAIDTLVADLSNL